VIRRSVCSGLVEREECFNDRQKEREADAAALSAVLWEAGGSRAWREKRERKENESRETASRLTRGWCHRTHARTHTARPWRTRKEKRAGLWLRREAAARVRWRRGERRGESRLKRNTQGQNPHLHTHARARLSPSPTSSLRRRRDGRDVRVTRVGDRKHRHPVQFAAGRPQLDVRARVVVHGRLGEHGVVVDLGAADGRNVGGDDDELA